MKEFFLKHGNFSFVVRTVLSLSGAALIYFAVYYISDKNTQWVVGSIGLAIGSVGMYAAQAKMLHLLPFTNDPLGWRKAKQTYQVDEVVNGSAEKDSQP